VNGIRDRSRRDRLRHAAGSCRPSERRGRRECRGRRGLRDGGSGEDVGAANLRVPLGCRGDEGSKPHVASRYENLFGCPPTTPAAIGTCGATVATSSERRRRMRSRSGPLDRRQAIDLSRGEKSAQTDFSRLLPHGSCLACTCRWSSGNVHLQPMRRALEPGEHGRGRRQRSA
jgi:hypothetical protein